MDIMLQTLDELKYSYNKNSNEMVTVSGTYGGITIDGNAGKIKYDSVHQTKVDKIKQNYTVNFYRDQAIREGNEIRQSVNDQGIITLQIIRP